MKPWTGTKIKRSSGAETAPHTHRLAQLFLVRKGLVKIKTPHGCWIVPEGRVGRIPPHLRHSATTVGDFLGWTVYLPERRKMKSSDAVSILVSSPLLEASLERLSERKALNLAKKWDKSLAVVIETELAAAKFESLGLLLPTSQPLGKVAESILKQGPQGKKITAWADEVGMSVRSFSRHFFAETGKTFEAWRTLATHQKAVELLSQNQSVTEVALTLGYESLSAFIASFRRCYGSSPKQYLKRERS